MKKLNNKVYSRAWFGGLRNINNLLNWLEDKNIMNKTDSSKKNSLFRKYYRYFNDGDVPVSYKMGTTKYDWLSDKEREIVEERLEIEVENFIRYILIKYNKKYNRNDFRVNK